MNPSPPVLIGIPDAAATIDDPAGWEVRAGHDAQQLIEPNLRVVDHGETGVDRLGEIVRWNVGRHTDRDSRRSVHQKIRETRREYCRLLLSFIVVRDEIDRLTIEIVEQFVGDPVQPDLGVPHGGRGITVNGTEVTLTINKGVAQRKGLGQPYDRIIHGGISVRMILADHVAHDAGRFLVGLIPVVAKHRHGVEDPSMYRLQPVAHIWKRTANDYTHRVIEVGLTHLLLEIGGKRFLGYLIHKGSAAPPGAGQRQCERRRTRPKCRRENRFLSLRILPCPGLAPHRFSPQKRG